MEFRPTGDVRELADLVRELCLARGGEDTLAELDVRFGPGTESAGTHRANSRLNEQLWSGLVDAGVPLALSPVAAGGDGLGVTAAAYVFYELGRALAPVPLDSAVAAARALAAAGDAENARAVAGGELIAAVPDSPTGFEAGTDERAMGSDVILHSVPWAPAADLLCEPVAGGVRVYRLSVDGVNVERLVPVDFSCAGRVTISAEAASAADRFTVSAEAAEFEALRRRVHLAAHQWGVLDAALERTARYASERNQFGRPIGTFQGVSGRLADGLIDVDAVRLSTLRAADELDNCRGVPGPAAHTAVATAHFWASEAAHRVAHTAVHIHGGTGLDRSEPLHRYFLAAKAGEFRLGGATAQLADLGRTLALHGDPWA